MNKQKIDEISKLIGDSLDEQVRDSLKYGTSFSYVNPSKWFLFKFSIKRRLTNMRIYIAEWIGGDSLHEHCGDY